MLSQPTTVWNFAAAEAAATAAPTRSAAAITRRFSYFTTTVKDFAVFMPDSSVTVSTPSYVPAVAKLRSGAAP